MCLKRASSTPKESRRANSGSPPAHPSSLFRGAQAQRRGDLGFDRARFTVTSSGSKASRVSHEFTVIFTPETPPPNASPGPWTRRWCVRTLSARTAVASLRH